MDTETLTAKDGSSYTARKDEATGTWSIDDYPVFAVGTWHGDTYDEGIVDRIIEFTNRAMRWVVPKLGIGHPDPGQNETALPAFGRFGAMRRISDRVFASLERIPNEVFQKIKAGQFGPVSVQMRKFRDPETGLIGHIIDRVKFLGLVAPEVATIAPSTEFSSGETITLSWEEYKPFSADTGTAVADPADSADTGPSDPTEANSGIATEGEVMNDDLKAREESLAKERAEFERAKAEAEAELDQRKIDIEEQRKSQFSATVESAWERICPVDGERRATPGEKDTFVEACTEIGQDGKAFSAMVSAWMARPVIKQNTGKPQVNGDGEVDAAVEAKMFSATREIMAERKVDIATAAAIVAEEHPEWVEWDRKNFSCVASGCNSRIVNKR